MPVVEPTYRPTGHWTFVMVTHPWTRFRTGGAGNGARFKTPVVDAALTTGLLALVVTPLVVGVARASTKVLAIQRTLAGVLGMFYAFDWSRPDLVDVQIPLLTFPASSLALLGAAVHRFITQFRAIGGAWVLVASNLFRMFAIRELLQDYLLTLDGLQVLEQVAESDKSSYLRH